MAHAGAPNTSVREVYRAHDEPVNHLNAAVHLQCQLSAQQRQLAVGQTRLVFLQCECPPPNTVQWRFHAFRNARGAASRLPWAVQELNLITRRQIHDHFAIHHKESVRPTVPRGKRPRDGASCSTESRSDDATFHLVNGPGVSDTTTSDHGDVYGGDRKRARQTAPESDFVRGNDAVTVDRPVSVIDEMDDPNDVIVVPRRGAAAAAPIGPIVPIVAAPIPSTQLIAVGGSSSMIVRSNGVVVPPASASQMMTAASTAMVKTRVPIGYVEVAHHGGRGTRSFATQLMVHPAFVHKSMQPVQLPCMLQNQWYDPKYGQHTAWAVLLWVDQRAKVTDLSVKELHQLTSANNDYFVTLPPVGHDSCAITMRGLYCHKIVHVDPPGSLVADLVGKMFSSFFVSHAQLTGKHSVTPPLQAWHLVHQPRVTVASMMVEQGFIPLDVSKAVSSLEFADPAGSKTPLDFLSGEWSSREEPLLRMTMIQPAPKIIYRKRRVPTITDAVEKALFLSGQLQEADLKSVVIVEPKNQFGENELDEEEVEQEHRLPGWIALFLKFSAPRFEKRGLAGALRDPTFRDLCAAQCESECNELECAPHESAVGGATHRCKHGRQHTPYLAPSMAACRTADKHDVNRKEGRSKRNPMKYKYSKEDRAQFEDLDRDPKNGPAFFLPVQSDAELLQRKNKRFICSEWSRRIQIESIRTLQEFTSVRIFGGPLMNMLIRAFVGRGDTHPTHGYELDRMLYTLVEREQVIDTPAKLESLMQLWRPLPMEATWSQLKKPLLPCRWTLLGANSPEERARTFERRITPAMRKVLAADPRCTKEVAESMLMPLLINQYQPVW